MSKDIIQAITKTSDYLINIASMLIEEKELIKIFPGVDRIYAIIKASNSIPDAILKSKIENALKSLSIDTRSFFKLISESDWFKVSGLIFDYINRNDYIKTEYIVLLFLYYTEEEFDYNTFLRLLFAIDNCDSSDLLLLKNYKPMSSKKEKWNELIRLSNSGLVRVCYEVLDEGGNNSQKIYDLTELGAIFINYIFIKDKSMFIKILDKDKNYYRTV